MKVVYETPLLFCYFSNLGFPFLNLFVVFVQPLPGDSHLAGVDAYMDNCAISLFLLHLLSIDCCRERLIVHPSHLQSGPESQAFENRHFFSAAAESGISFSKELRQDASKQQKTVSNCLFSLL